MVYRKFSIIKNSSAITTQYQLKRCCQCQLKSNWPTNLQIVNRGGIQTTTKVSKLRLFPTYESCSKHFSDFLWTKSKASRLAKWPSKQLLKNLEHVITFCLANFSGGCIAQRNHSCFPPSSPRSESRLCRDFSSLLLSGWTVSSSNPSSAKQWISQTQLAVTSRSKNNKNNLIAFTSV